MRGSEKGRAPQELVSWIAREENAGIVLSYRNWPAQLRGDIVGKLYEEQTGQCVYCGRAIVLERHERFHLEHFRPRSRYPELNVNYSNIYLSCGPRKEEGSLRDTCGHKKNDWFEEDCHVEPADKSCSVRFVYRSSGQVVADGTSESAKMIEVLNLNDQELLRERFELIEELDNELNENVSAVVLIETYMQVSNLSRVSFANVAIRYLRAEIAAA